MLALMVTPERSDAAQVMHAPIHPAQALLTRFTCWEKRVENLIEFFTQVQSFQKTHSRHYTALSLHAGQTYGEEERLREDGVIRIWKGLQEKTAELARFYDGLAVSYDDTVLRELKMKLAEIRIFRGDLNRIRSKEAVKAEKRQGRFEDAVNNLTKSLNQVGEPKQRDDPLVANRKCRLHLEKWVQRDNELKARISEILQRCANFEFKLVPKIKEAINAYVSISQNEFQIVGEAFTNLQDISEAVDRGVDWVHFQNHEPSLRGGHLQLMDPAKLTFSNWDHPYTVPVISGEIAEWKSLRRRWVKGYYCVTGQGCLMQFEHPLDQLVGNLVPRKSRDLRGALLGSINIDGRDAWFTIMSDRWLQDQPSYGVKKYAKAPIKLAKHTMSKLTTIKLQMPGEDAQQWHDILAQFTRTRNTLAVDTTLGLGVLGIPSTRAPKAGPPPTEEDEDDPTEEVQSSASSIAPSAEESGSEEEEEEDMWEKRRYQLEKQTFEAIADRQPGHITHNPW